jgi:hypothetical protein
MRSAKIAQRTATSGSTACDSLQHHSIREQNKVVLPAAVLQFLFFICCNWQNKTSD